MDRVRLPLQWIFHGQEYTVERQSYKQIWYAIDLQLQLDHPTCQNKPSRNPWITSTSAMIWYSFITVIGYFCIYEYFIFSSCLPSFQIEVHCLRQTFVYDIEADWSEI